jgi:hypothetical protein
VAGGEADLGVGGIDGVVAGVVVDGAHGGCCSC